MKISALALTACLIVFTPAWGSSIPPMELEIILDASGSMNEAWDGTPKRMLAQKELGRLIEKLSQSENVSVALRIFGHDEFMEKEGKSCFNSELKVPFAVNHSGRVLEVIGSMKAFGKTPIAFSLEEAGKDFERIGAKHPVIFLITDGKETCGGKPSEVLRRLRARGIDAKVHVVGLGLDEEAQSEMRQICQLSGGNFHDVKSGGELGESLTAVTDDLEREGLTIRREAVRGYSLAGGSDVLSAPADIKKGKYRLGRALPTGKRAYYRLQTEPTQLVRIQVGPDVSGDPQAHARVTLEYFIPGEARMAGAKAVFSSRQPNHAPFLYYDPDGKGIVFSLGDDFGRVGEDTYFEILIQEAGDLKPGWDAPAGVLDETQTLEYGESEGFLGLKDNRDVYRVEALKGNERSLSVGLEFEDSRYRFEVAVFDETNGQRIRSFPVKQKSGLFEIPMLKSYGSLRMEIRDRNGPGVSLGSRYRLRLSAKA